MAHSRLQKEVLSLYRELLRAARGKSPEARREMERIISAEFRKNTASIPYRDFQRVEYFLSKGHRQLETLRNSSVSGVSIVTPRQKIEENQRKEAFVSAEGDEHEKALHARIYL